MLPMSVSGVQWQDYNIRRLTPSGRPMRGQLYPRETHGSALGCLARTGSPLRSTRRRGHPILILWSRSGPAGTLFLWLEGGDLQVPLCRQEIGCPDPQGLGISAAGRGTAVDAHAAQT